MPPADPQRLAEELQALSRAPERLSGWARRRASPRSVTPGPTSPSEVERVYERAPRPPSRDRRRARCARSSGWRTADGRGRVPAGGCPRWTPSPLGRRGRHRTARRIGLGVTAALGIGLTFIAAQRIGVDRVVTSIVRSDATWVLVATGLMIASMFLRASSWYAIAKAALPRQPSAGAMSPRRR